MYIFLKKKRYIQNLVEFLSKIKQYDKIYKEVRFSRSNIFLLYFLRKKVWQKYILLTNA